MFLEKYSEEYLLSLLNEAPADNAMGQTATMSTDSNAAYEPQEQNAEMDLGSGSGDMGMDPGMEEMDMGDGSGATDPSMDGMGGGMDGSTPVNTKDLFKKRKLFQDYKDLLTSMEHCREIAVKILNKDLPEEARKIYSFLNHKMDENQEKVQIILAEQYFNLSYQQLLTIYMYIKMATKLYADMIKQLNDTYREEKKKFS